MNSFNKIKKIYDLIFIDTESNDYKKHNVDKYINYVKKDYGVVVYLYYNKIKDEIDTKYKYEIINYNTIKLLIYKNKKIKVEDENEKTYIIISPHMDNPKLYLDNNWKPNNNTEYSDLIFVESRYIKYKKIFNIKCKYKNLLLINPEFNFVNKLELFKYVKKNNPTIYKKYFPENYELGKINKMKNSTWNKIQKLFDKNTHWIVKPIPGEGGFGVKLFNDYIKCKEYLLNFKKDKSTKTKHTDLNWIIQKYITNPLLIKKYNKKFHFRVNFLVTLINNKLELYIFNHYTTALSVKEFDLNDLSMKSHDTRFGSHLDLKKKDFKEQAGNYPEFYNKMFGKDKTEKIDKQMKDLFKYIKNQLKLECYKDESENCFRHFGADILVTDKYNIKVLELNEKPGNAFNIFTKYKTDFYKGMFNIVLKNKVSKHYTKC